MRLSLKFARRYLFSRKSVQTINLISWISMAGMTIGTAAFILILSVFNGFEGFVVSLYDSFYPDIRVEPAEMKIFHVTDSLMTVVRSVDGVESVSQVLEENALLRFENRQAIATIKGVDDQYVRVTGMDTCMAFGDTFQLVHNGVPYAIIGAGIDRELYVNLKDPLNPVSVYLPRRSRGMGFLPGDEFKRREIQVWGIFAIQDDFDAKYVFMPVDFVRSMLKYSDEATALEIKINPRASRDEVRARLAARLGDNYRVLGKFQQNAMLFRIMRIEKLVVYLVLSFVLLIVAFNMVGSLSLLVIDKKKDIGILKTMGATPVMIRRIFLQEGLLQAGISIGLGFLIAISLALLQQQYGIIRIQGGNSMLLDRYPVALHWLDFVSVAVIVLLISLGASWFPAAQAARQPQILQS